MDDENRLENQRVLEERAFAGLGSVRWENRGGEDVAVIDAPSEPAAFVVRFGRLLADRWPGNALANSLDRRELAASRGKALAVRLESDGRFSCTVVERGAR